MKCKHCGEALIVTIDQGMENVGPHERTCLYSCDTEVSGLPYGFSAEPEGSKCSRPCLGAASLSGCVCPPGSPLHFGECIGTLK